MKKIYLYPLLALTGTLVSACNQDSINSVTFGATLNGNTQEIYAGDAVTFDFSGRPDYIVFYSGEDGNKYANKDRLKVDITSAELSYSIKQQYTRAPHRDMEIMSILVSEDFTGDYSAAGLNKATWQRLSGLEEGQLKVPTCPAKGNGTETVSDAMDFSAYKDKKFYLAFRYYAPAVTGADTDPRVDVQPLTISKILADGSGTTMNDPQAQFGFNYIVVNELKGANFSASNSSLLFQPGKDNTSANVDVWAVSKQIDLTEVSPDMGTPVKALNMKTDSYTHVYEQPGEYIVTFVASNANQWDSKSTVREMKIVVKERPVQQ